LPHLLAACVLYIGNDSGPKHIAAAVGVPTIGIHSGVVDAAEWGPIGRRAVALQRDMTCSPCYLASAADCPRDLACLRFLEPASVYQTAQLLLARPVAAVAVREVMAGGASGLASAAGPLCHTLDMTRSGISIDEQSDEFKSSKTGEMVTVGTGTG
jgi:hypothetical protein